jgi:glycosyltransferase involved in cell wall biosynthesis
LAIAGRWDPRYPQARQKAAALGIEDSVIFLGDVAEADLPALYSGPTLFVFPSLYEGFGLPPLEAMACGTPVIASNSSSLPEVIGDTGIMVDPLDVGALLRAIELVLRDERVRREMRARGLEQAAKFSWERAAAMTMEVYQGVLGHKNRW